MAHLISNIPYFKCWVRREFTCNHEKYHDEYLHALAIAVNTIPEVFVFQVVFTGCEAECDDIDEGNIHRLGKNANTSFSSRHTNG